MTGGYNGWQDDNGEWRFSITILPEGNKPGQMILGLKPEDGSEPETKGLTESEFRQIIAEGYGQSAAEIERAVQASKGHR